MSTKLFRTILPVDDIQKATEFYSSILDLPGQRVSPGRHYFLLGEIVFAIYDPVADGDELGSGWSMHENQYLYFSVTDIVDARARAMTAGAIVENEISVMPWGERLFYARDPFGNPICFVDEPTTFTG